MDARMIGAVSILAVCAMLVAGMAFLAPQSEAAASDVDSWVITTSDLTFDPYQGYFTKTNLTDGERFASNQQYSGAAMSSVTWEDMAKGAWITLPVYLPGTEQVIAEVESGDSYAGSYYLYGWAPKAVDSPDDSSVMRAGDSYQITSQDTRLYAVWKATSNNGGNREHNTNAVSVMTHGEGYRYLATADDVSNSYYYTVMHRAFSNEYAPQADQYIKALPDWLNGKIDGGVLFFAESNPAPGNYYVEFGHKKEENLYEILWGNEWYYIWWVITVLPSDTQEYKYSYDTGNANVAPSGGTVRYGQTIELSNGFVGKTEITSSDRSVTLAGWKLTGPSNTQSYYMLGQTVSTYDLASMASNGTLKFEPWWEKADGVVVLSLDGASLKNVDAYKVRYDDVITLPSAYSENEKLQFAKKDCTLIGWNTLTQSDSTNEYALWAPGSMLTMDTGVLKAEAVWWETSELSSLKTVTFDPNGGSYGITTQKVPSGYFVNLPEYGVTKEGMKFLGWSYVENGTESDVIVTDSIPVTSDITLHAVYGTDSVNPTVYRVMFNTNGGKGSVATQVVKQDGYAHQPTGITKEGCILVGWKDANSKQWDFSSHQVKGDMTLTADWAEHWTYTVSGLTVSIQLSSKYERSPTVDWGDGTADNELEHTYESVHSSSYISVMSYSSSGASDTVYWSERTLTGLEGAYVPQAERVTVTFFASPGKFPGNASWLTVEIVKGTTVSEPTDAPTYDDEHKFAYWTYDGFDIEFDFSQNIYSDTTFRATWSDVFITSFNPCYDGAAAIPSVKTPSGESLTLPSPGVREGYVFAGWCTMFGGAGTNVGNVGETYTPPSSRTLYAYWKEVESDTEVTVSFDAKGGSAVEDVTVRLGESFKLPDSKLDGHELIAWYKGSEKIGGAGVEYAPTESCTLTAQWLDSSSGEVVDQDDYLIPEACISIETMADGSGWGLHGSGRNAAEFHWYVSSDGKRSWNDYGTGRDLFIPSTDYTVAGTYWVQLTTVSKTGNTATSYGSFTVGDADDGKRTGIIAYLAEHPAVAVGTVLAVLALIFAARWYL